LGVQRRAILCQGAAVLDLRAMTLLCGAGLGRFVQVEGLEPGEGGAGNDLFETDAFQTMAYGGAGRDKVWRGEGCFAVQAAGSIVQPRGERGIFGVEVIAFLPGPGPRSMTVPGGISAAGAGWIFWWIMTRAAAFLMVATALTD